VTVIIGEVADHPGDLRMKLNQLTDRSGKRGYLDKGEIVSSDPVTYCEDDLFAQYHQPLTMFRNKLVADQPDAMEKIVNQWVSKIRSKQYAPEIVKDWMLKLLLDIRLKIHSLQHFRVTHTAEIHKEIAGIDSLHELEEWLIQHLNAVAPVVETLKDQ